MNGGPHRRFRAVHAKGTICEGHLHRHAGGERSSPEPAHLQGDPVETTVRFSNETATRRTPDADPLAGRGMAVKFHLPGRRRDGHRLRPAGRLLRPEPEDFLEMTLARIPDPETGQPDPEKVGAFLADHPETGVALQKALPKLAPTTSFVTSDYRALHAFCLVDAEGGSHWGRYTWEPEEGPEYLNEEQLEAAATRLPPGGDRERLAERHRAVHARVHSRERRRPARRPDGRMGG